MYRLSLALVGLLVTGTAVALAPASPHAAEPAAAPKISEWLNQAATLRQTVTALDRPAPEGKSLGEIAAGAQIEAIGVVAGGRWVQIELPNKAIAYIPDTAIKLVSNAPATLPAPAQKPAPVAATALPTGAPVAAAPPPRAPLPVSAPVTTSSALPSATAAAVVSGPVTEVPNATTLVVGTSRIRLIGVDPGPPEVLAPFEDWLLHKAGTLKCTPIAQTGRYLCRAADGSDVGATAVLSGVARVGEGATADYRKFENQAREAKRGLWKNL